jgi:hypothetical protein
MFKVFKETRITVEDALKHPYFEEYQEDLDSLETTEEEFKDFYFEGYVILMNESAKMSVWMN